MIFCMAMSVSQSSDFPFACPTLHDRSPRNTAHDDIWYRSVHTPLGIEPKMLLRMALIVNFLEGAIVMWMAILPIADTLVVTFSSMYSWMAFFHWLPLLDLLHHLVHTYTNFTADCHTILLSSSAPHCHLETLVFSISFARARCFARGQRLRSSSYSHPFIYSRYSPLFRSIYSVFQRKILYILRVNTSPSLTTGRLATEFVMAPV